MDPDQALQDLRNALTVRDIGTAVEAFEELDDWLTMGGRKPADWDD